MRLSGTKTAAIHQYRGLGNQLYDLAGNRPSLDLDFAGSKSLVDQVSGQNLVTFTRASSGTYVDSTGTLRTATTNLLLQSNQFDTTWTNTNSSETSGAGIAIDGTNTAWELKDTADVSTIAHSIQQTYSFESGVTYTFSFFAKLGTKDRAVPVLPATQFGGTARTVSANLATGTLGGTNADAASISNFGNGWYRVSITHTATATSSGAVAIRIGVSTGSTYQGDGTGTILIWGAQLEQSSTVGEYIPTTSTINSAPRFDHNPTTGESLGLLVEEQRTNLLLNSATLSTQNVTVTAVAHTLSFTGTGTITLSGTSTAGPLVGTGTGESNRVSLTFTPTAGTLTLTVSGTVTNAQLEAGPFRTSYIPTTTAAATRSADVASITGSAFSSWYRQDEGTVFADVNSAPVSNIVQVAFDISEGLGNERMFQRRNAGGIAATAVVDNGVTQGDIGATVIAASARYRSGFGYKLNDLSIAVNGGAEATDTSATIPTPDRLFLGQNFASGQSCNGTLRRLTYWPARLPNSTLQAITQ
jgi:hypothetical protein